MRNKNIFIIGFVLLLGCSEEQNSESVIQTQSTDSVATVVVDNGIKRPVTIEFPSLDGLFINSGLVEIDPKAPSILLCHQAGYNLHEYDEMIPRLNELGFNCLAIDQRSGGVLFDLVNRTADRAISENLPVDYLSAEQDIAAGINYLFAKYEQPIIVWGSSYSAALALHLCQNNEKVKAVIAFSPDDYFGENKPSLSSVLKNYKKPFFITSSKREGKTISKWFQPNQLTDKQVHFIPQGNGKHGSSVLWKENPDHEEYWKAIESFLNSIK